MSQEKMIQARDLIRAQKYGEARQLLKSVDHPKAREWETKIDKLELGDPFAAAQSAPVARNQPSHLLQDAVVTMTQYEWKLTSQTETTAYFEKRRPVSAIAGTIVVLFFSLIGTILVCVGIATARKETVTLQADAAGRLRASSSNKGVMTIGDESQVETLAASVSSNGMTYGAAIIVGILSMVVWWVFLGGVRYY